MKISRTLITLLALTFAPVAMSASSIATVNGKPINKSIYDFIIKDAANNGKKVDDQVKQAVTNKLIDSEIVYQAAQKKGLDKSAEYIAREELARRELLTAAYLKDFMAKHPISDAAVKAEYENYKKAIGNKEYKAKHILVKTEAEAKAVITKLAKGSSFDKLAKEKSLDPGSKDKGGDLGWFSPATMVKPFSAAVAKLAKGKYTQTPVQSQFGWHVIQLTDSRKSTPMAYDKVKDGLKKQLQQKKLSAQLADLRSKAKVSITK